MTEFKQIIGRGTRINEEFGKYWFTIMDFKRATELFADPGFDGDPVIICTPPINEPPVPPDDETGEDGDDDEGDGQGIRPDVEPPRGQGGRVKYVVADVSIKVMDERVQYYGTDGRLITESIKDYTRSCVVKQFASLDEFLRKWTAADQKKAIIEEMASEGVLWEPLCQDIEKKLGKQLDPFDLICHVAYGQPPLSRRERADNVRKRNYFTKYSEQSRRVLEALLDKYADTGIENIEDLKVLQMEPFAQMGTAPEIVKAFGGKPAYLKALKELEEQLYA